CGTAAPRLGFINNVVVDQRGRVDDLDHRAETYGAAFGVGKELGRKQQQSRPDPLASPAAQVLADIGDGAHAGDGIVAEFAFDGCQIVTQQVKNFFGSGCGGCAQKAS